MGRFEDKWLTVTVMEAKADWLKIRPFSSPNSGNPVVGLLVPDEWILRSSDRLRSVSVDGQWYTWGEEDLKKMRSKLASIGIFTLEDLFGGLRQQILNGALLQKNF